jgi:hypothetical protein
MGLLHAGLQAAADGLLTTGVLMGGNAIVDDLRNDGEHEQEEDEDED